MVSHNTPLKRNRLQFSYFNAFLLVLMLGYIWGQVCSGTCEQSSKENWLINIKVSLLTRATLNQDPSPGGQVFFDVQLFFTLKHTNTSRNLDTLKNTLFPPTHIHTLRSKPQIRCHCTFKWNYLICMFCFFCNKHYLNSKTTFFAWMLTHIHIICASSSWL